MFYRQLQCWCAVALIAAFGDERSVAATAAREKRALNAIQALEASRAGASSDASRRAIAAQIDEIRASCANNARPPIPPTIDAFVLPFTHYRYATARVGLGSVPAANLVSAQPDSPLRTRDPLPSSFWRPPNNIGAVDLASGFGRARAPSYDDVLWEYAGPKKSYGGHAGFDAQSGNRRIKVKFGETHSEPFTARVFHALGYNVDPTDHARQLKIRYSRRLFDEFNSRRPVNTRITILGVLPVWTIRFQPIHDPIEFFRSAVLRNGAEVTGEELANLLAGKTGNPEMDISYLVTAPANVQPKAPDAEQSIGPWDFGQLGHENLRELRGAGLLAAWLGWHDSRFDNTRLRVIHQGDRIELKHYFSDLGGGLGRSVGLLSRTAEDPAAFPSFFTRPPMHQGKHRMTVPFRIVNFRPIDRTPAFEQMTVDDARWMANLIAQLTPAQILSALQASGFSDADATTLCAKLLSRRDHMLRDLGP